jgi:hypothetical protein
VRSDQGRTGLEPLGGAFGGHCAYNICEVVCTSWSWSVPGNSRRSNKERSQCEHLRTVETMETLVHQAVLAWHSGGRYCMRRTGGASYPFRLYSSTPLTLRLEGALFDSRQRTNARLVWTFPPNVPQLHHRCVVRKEYQDYSHATTQQSPPAVLTQITCSLVHFRAGHSLLHRQSSARI